MCWFYISDIETDNHVFEDLTTLETVSLSAWLKKPEVVASFKCQEVNLSGYVYERYLSVELKSKTTCRSLKNIKS